MPAQPLGIEMHTCARTAMRHERKLRRKIARAHAAGRRKRAAYLTRRYLESYDARFVATTLAYRRLKPHRRPPKALLPKIAASLDPWHGSTKPVIFHLKPKASNGHEFRTVMDFGIEDRALQYLVRAALTAQADLHPNQFATRGGTHAAIGAVMEALEGGYNWVIETDIRDCFPSFDGNRLPDLLPIPKEVTRKVILSSHLNLAPGNFSSWVGPDDLSAFPDGNEELFADEIAEARRGIPQGSAVSPLVAEVLLAPVIAQMPDCGIVLGYADNFLVLARNGDDAVSITEALWSALKAHPAGPLWPKKPRVYPPNQSVEFLGYSLKIEAGGYRALPSAKNLSLFEHEFAKGLDRITRSSNFLAINHRRLARLRRYVRSWTGAFSRWDGAATHRENHLGKTKAVAAALDIQEVDV